MAKKYFCDLCDKQTNECYLLTVMFDNGEHPHNGSTMHKRADCCIDCLKDRDIKLTSEMEFSDARRKT